MAFRCFRLRGRIMWSYLINSSLFTSPNQNAVTHKKLAQGVQQVTFKWTAPANLSERVVFLATIAKNGGVFWVQQKSDILNVK